jgi:hypothetical protein
LRCPAAGTGTFYMTPSGTADCTWRQQGVYQGSPADTRFSSVPGDGTITRIAVRSGPNPAPLRFVIIRQYAAPGEGGTTQCCFFEYEQPNEVQPRPNDVTTFDVNMPVRRNTINGAPAIDLIGFSARSGTGSLPLHSNGQNNAFQ